MKDLRIIKLFITLIILIVPFTAVRAGNYGSSENSPLIIIDTNYMLVELIYGYQFSEFVDAAGSFEAVEESEMLIEEELVLEEWMLDFSSVENEEVIIEESLNFELWMKHPKNWNIYDCK